MARISIYPTDEDITAEDIILGTDGGAGMGLASKNFPVGDIAEFIMTYIQDNSSCFLGCCRMEGVVSFIGLLDNCAMDGTTSFVSPLDNCAMEGTTSFIGLLDNCAMDGTTN